MGIIINILLGICVVWTIVSVLFLLFLNRPSVKKHISEYIANKMADSISDIVYGENRKITNHIYR
ncbi:MAG: hypothetical protein HXM02_05875 [[Eubacterium] sulci]|nr:hypothetical protein [[Eubacterium] sulci]